MYVNIHLYCSIYNSYLYDFLVYLIYEDKRKQQQHINVSCMNKNITIWFTFGVFSSPEHEVLSELLWSFNVRRPSSVVRASVRASVRPSTISLNYISSETAYWILTKLHRNDPWVVPYQSCSNRSSWLHK